MFISHIKRWSGLTIVLAASLVAMQIPIAHATIDYDAYADAVDMTSGCSNVGNPQNTVGAPDGTYYTVVGVDNSITLNMGVHEDGIGDLDIRIGPLTVAASMQVSFLNSEKELITSETQALAVSLLNPTTYTIPYDYDENDDQTYQYVRIATLSALGFGIDAITATEYLGADPEQDSDGDTYSDRDEIENGTDPFDVRDPADPIPPEIVITSHVTSQTISGTVTLTASASDNDEIVDVQFIIDDVPVGGEDTTSPYQYVWDTTSYTNGTYDVYAVTRDPTGNYTASDHIYLNVNN